jgi:dsRNA-specific ribonuclease
MARGAVHMCTKEKRDCRETSSDNALGCAGDAKSVLQDICQKLKLPLPSYQLLEQRGDNHCPTFIFVGSMESATCKHRCWLGTRDMYSLQGSSCLVLKDNTL